MSSLSSLVVDLAVNSAELRSGLDNGYGRLCGFNGKRDDLFAFNRFFAHRLFLETIVIGGHVLHEDAVLLEQTHSLARDHADS